MNWEIWWHRLRLLFLPLGFLWGEAMRLRRRAYGAGIFPSYRPRAKVISVGNLSLGGEGKTPLVAWLAEHLRQRGQKTAILTRGYRGQIKKPTIASEGKGPLLPLEILGDEVFLLARKTKAPIMVSPDRVAGAFWAQRYFEAEILILDDGFQHLRLERDLDLVLFSGETNLSRERVFPAGRLREPLSCLVEADAFLITKTNLLVENLDLITKLKAFGKPIFRLPYYLGDPYPLNSKAPLEAKDLVAFCGLAKPESFFSGLKQAGYRLAETISFPDHHLYTKADLLFLKKLAREKGALLATTEKDAVKVEAFAKDLPPCYVFPLTPVPGRNFERFIWEKLEL